MKAKAKGHTVAERMPLSSKARKAALIALVGGGSALLVQMYRAAKKADGYAAVANWRRIAPPRIARAHH